MPTSIRTAIAATALLLLISGCSSSDSDSPATSSTIVTTSSADTRDDETTDESSDDAESASGAGTARRFPGGVPFGLPDPCTIGTEDEVSEVLGITVGNARAGGISASTDGSDTGSVLCRWSDDEETTTLEVTVANNETYAEAVAELAQSTPLSLPGGAIGLVDSESGIAYVDFDDLLWTVSIDNEELADASASIAALIVE